MADSKVQTNKAGGTDSLPIRKLAEPIGSHRYQSDLNGAAGSCWDESVAIHHNRLFARAS
ncbi:hypothetical protein KAM380_016200 [Aeromonas caviae]|nr:hypothetical protein KAM380_016200 [Aeromonas caviae]